MMPRISCFTLVIALLVPAAGLAQPWASSPSNEKIFQAIGVREGITVCEIGAGSGTLSIEAAKLVGPKGRVLASELGESRVGKLKEAADTSGLPQITVVAGHEERTNFPDAACDALFMRDVYHHFTDPAKMDAAILAALKPGGRVAVVDFTPPGEEAAPGSRAKDNMHGVTPDTVAREMKDAGFDVVSSERGQRWFVVVLSKPQKQA